MGSGAVADRSASSTDSGPSQRVKMVGSDRGAHHVARLVVGFDQQPVSLHALQVAADLAVRLHAELHVVHAVDLDDYPIDPDRADWEERAHAVLAHERELAQQLLSRTSVPWTYHAARGEPVHLLSAVAEEQDALMIVVGTRGHSRSSAIARLLEGSVTRALTGRHQHRPVLIVPMAETAP